MTTTTKTKKTTQKRTGKKTNLPPSADVVTISGREYIIAPLDEFQEWDEDRQLAAVMQERMNDGEPLISFEEFEKRLDQKNRRKKK